MNHLQRYAGLTLAFALSGCSSQSAPVQAAATDAQAALGAPDAIAVSADAVARLRQQADAAVREQRLYAPAGDNAIEFYLVLRERYHEGEAATAALTQLQPYLLIASEQALSRGDVDEGRRLLALLTRIDAAAPSLPRLRAALTRAQAQAGGAADDLAAFTNARLSGTEQVAAVAGRREHARLITLG